MTEILQDKLRIANDELSATPATNDDDETGSCPECGAPLTYPAGGGEKCTACDYWFCF